MTTILIVEDEESLADPLAFLLRKEGFDPIVAHDGKTALAEFGRHDVDIVLLDLMLPGMSGTDVCKQLRATSSVPVIMVTARDSEIDKVVGLELGADDYVTKPYSSRELIARIRAVLRRGGEAVEAEEEFEEDDSKINDKYRGFDYKFKIIDHLEGHTKEIKLMSVKGQIITGTLDFLGQVSQLSEFINTEDYIRKIESLNQRILPVLADTVPKCQELIEELEEKIEEYKLDLSDMWLNQGLKNYRNNKNEEEYTKSEKEKLEKVDKKYYGIVKKKKDAEQDLKHSRNLLKSISIYIRKIETYFDQVQ